MPNKRRNFIKWSILSSLTAKSAFSSLANFNAGKQLEPRDLKLFDVDPEKFWKVVRSKFPLGSDRIYFNTAGLGASPTIVSSTLIESMSRLDLSGESGHSEIEKPRAAISEFLNADPNEIAITRNTTEGINIAARSIPLQKGDEVILTTHEHVGGAAIWILLQQELGIKIKLVELDPAGENNFELITQAITKKTRAICISHVTCTTGTILPVEDIITYCRPRDIFTVIDGAQAVGMIQIDLKKLNPDFYATSGHKWMYGPNGSGILFINQNVIKKLNPVFAGAYTDSHYDLNKLELTYRMSADRTEYGTRNTPQILALGATVNFIKEIGVKRIENRCLELARILKAKLGQNKHIEILSPIKDLYASGIVTFKIKGLDYLLVQKELVETFNIRVRGVHENGLNALRVSCGIYNSKDEIDGISAAIDIISEPLD